jgi:His-Xaa-Ser system protein HxsD
MTERELTFDRSTHSADAIQRATYKLSDRLSCDLASEDVVFRCTLHIQQEDPDVDALISEFRNEVLDETLRERIRDETKEVRNLILALAFSNTGLAEPPKA